MQNPIMAALGQRSQNNVNPQMQGAFANIRQIIGFIKNSRNPSAMVQQMAMQNPQFNAALQQAQQYVNSCGGNPQQALNNISQQVGMDVTQLFR